MRERRHRLVHRDLGCGRIVGSDMEAPTTLANLVWSGRAAVQQGSATEPDRDQPALVLRAQVDHLQPTRVNCQRVNRQRVDCQRVNCRRGKLSEGKLSLSGRSPCAAARGPPGSSRPPRWRRRAARRGRAAPRALPRAARPRRARGRCSRGPGSCRPSACGTARRRPARRRRRRWVSAGAAGPWYTRAARHSVRPLSFATWILHTNTKRTWRSDRAALVLGRA